MSSLVSHHNTVCHVQNLNNCWHMHESDQDQDIPTTPLIQCCANQCNLVTVRFFSFCIVSPIVLLFVFHLNIGAYCIMFKGKKKKKRSDMTNFGFISYIIKYGLFLSIVSAESQSLKPNVINHPVK